MVRHTQLLVFFAFLFLCWNGAALSQGADQAVSDAAKIQEGMDLKSSNDMLAAWLRMFGALITVLGIFFIGVFMFRKYGGALQNKTSQGHLKVLEYRALNQKNSVYVIDYQGESFLVATSQQGSPVLAPIRGENKSEQTLNLQDDGFKDEIRKAMNEPS